MNGPESNEIAGRILPFLEVSCACFNTTGPAVEQAVLAINTDDPVAARALFNKHGYTMKLLADDGDVSQRYGASAIPYTVIIDRSGVVREVIRGAGTDLTPIVDAVRTSE